VFTNFYFFKGITSARGVSNIKIERHPVYFYFRCLGITFQDPCHGIRNALGTKKFFEEFQNGKQRHAEVVGAGNVRGRCSAGRRAKTALIPLVVQSL